MKYEEETKTIINNSVFINPPEIGGHAAVSAVFREEKTVYQKSGSVRFELDGQITLSDCNRIIVWDFHAYGDDQKKRVQLLKEKMQRIADFFNEINATFQAYEIPENVDGNTED